MSPDPLMAESFNRMRARAPRDRSDPGAEEAHTEGLTRESFEGLLARLDPDREKAGELYEKVRKKLVRLFEWRGCRHSEELADETINRVARRMAEGVEVRSRGSQSYFFGVAHLVYKELLRREIREARALESEDWPPRTREEGPNLRLDGLCRCLEGLPSEQRRMVLQYYIAEDHVRVRKELSHEMGIPLNALRIRVHRACRKLELCVQQSIEGPARAIARRPPAKRT